MCRRGQCPPLQRRHTASFGVSDRQIADNLLFCNSLLRLFEFPTLQHYALTYGKLKAALYEILPPFPGLFAENGFLFALRAALLPKICFHPKQATQKLTSYVSQTCKTYFFKSHLRNQKEFAFERGFDPNDRRRRSWGSKPKRSQCEKKRGERVRK